MILSRSQNMKHPRVVSRFLLEHHLCLLSLEMPEYFVSKNVYSCLVHININMSTLPRPPCHANARVLKYS